jgi:predicted small lipoprotein YifL
MKFSRWTHRAGITLALCLALLIAAGCGHRGPADKPPEAPGDADKQAAKEKKIEAARAGLSPEDRALADAQDYCAVMTKQKLGSMGTPMKVMVKGQPVFICCKGCKSTAEDEPDQTLKTVEELKSRGKKK